MDLEQFQDLSFPINGIDLHAAFSSQRDGTTRTGLNVRTFEPTTDRARGGSRPGIAKYLPVALPGTGLIQHLASIAGVGGTLVGGQIVYELPTLDNYDFGDNPGENPALGITDPSTTGSGDPTLGGNVNRNPGRIIRPGGSGRQPTKVKPRATILSWNNPADITVGTALTGAQLNAVATDAMTGASVPGVFTYTPPAGTILSVGTDQELDVDFVPSDGLHKSASKSVTINVNSGGGGGTIVFGGSGTAQSSVIGATSISGALNHNVAVGDLVVVAVTGRLKAPTFAGDLPNPVVVTDSLGNTYTQILTDASVSGTTRHRGYSLSLWYSSITVAGACTITVAQSGFPVYLSLLGFVAGRFTGANATPLEGSNSNTGDGLADGATATTGTVVVLGANRMLFLANAFEFGTTTGPAGFSSFGSASPEMVVDVWYQTGVSSSQNISFTIHSSSGTTDFAAIGASFNHA